VGRVPGLDAIALRAVEPAAVLHDIRKLAIPSDLLRPQAPLSSGELEPMLQSLEAFGRKSDGHRIMGDRQRAVQHDVIAAAGEANQLPLVGQILGQFRDLQVLNEDAVKTLVEPAGQIELFAAPHRAEPVLGHQKQHHLAAVGRFIELAFPALTGGDAAFLRLDVTDDQSWERAVEGTIAELGGLDIVVNNAGVGQAGLFLDTPREEFDRVLAINFGGVVNCCRSFGRRLVDRGTGGHIVNMGSIAGRQAYENGALYITSKFAVRGFTYALREDLLGRPIHLTTVDPGLVGGTEFSPVRFRGDAEAARKVYEGVDALTAEDVADCVLFAVTRPHHVNVDEIVVKALAQSSGARILRTGR